MKDIDYKKLNQEDKHKGKKISKKHKINKERIDLLSLLLANYFFKDCIASCILLL